MAPMEKITLLWGPPETIAEAKQLIINAVFTIHAAPKHV